MNIGYQDGKIVCGKEYNCSDETDMLIFVDMIKTKFAKLEQENEIYKHKLTSISSIADGYYR